MSEEAKVTGKDAAKYFKFFRQNENKTLKVHYKLDKIPYLTLYKQNKDKFERLAKFCNDNNVNLAKYVKFYTIRLGQSDPDGIMRKSSFEKYLEYLKINDQYLKIYKWYMKSVNNIADDCIKYGFSSCVDYLKGIIENGRLGFEVLSGRISVYYLMTIQNIEEIYKNLDQLSKDELRSAFNMRDKIFQDVQEAFLMYKSTRVTPIQLTNEMITEYNNKKKD